MSAATAPPGVLVERGGSSAGSAPLASCADSPWQPGAGRPSAVRLSALRCFARQFTSMRKSVSGASAGSQFAWAAGPVATSGGHWR
eukprot:10729719-Alexandrium_andersonii.AAC.1